jgi:hypothetical protein
VYMFQETRLSWSWIGVLILLGFGAVRVSRIAWLAVPAMILVTAPQLANWWPRRDWNLHAPSRTAAWLTIVPLAVIGFVAAQTLWPILICIPILGDWRPDEAVALRLKRTGVTGRLVTWFDWGEYAIWHLSPSLRVSMDGRRETLYSDEMLRLHSAIYRGGADGDTWLAAEQPEYVWLPARYAVRRAWLEGHGYRIDAATAASYMAVRADLPSVAGSPPTLTGCFPGP